MLDPFQHEFSSAIKQKAKWFCDTSWGLENFVNLFYQVDFLFIFEFLRQFI